MTCLINYINPSKYLLSIDYLLYTNVLLLVPPCPALRRSGADNKLTKHFV